MKAICIKQPWASMIAQGKKTIEARAWRTKHRGEILIVASKSPAIKGLPSGQAVAVARISDCRPMEKSDEKATRCAVYPGAYSWILTDIRLIDPFPVRGKVGIFDIDMNNMSSLFYSFYCEDS